MEQRGGIGLYDKNVIIKTTGGMRIKEQGIKIIIYEPSINENYFLENKVVNNLNEFKRISDIIITNRYDNILSDVNDKIYTRDIYNRD